MPDTLRLSILSLLISLLSVISHLAVAAEITFRHLTVEDGLPGSTVYMAMQDSKGYIWLATDAGVSRYDGLTFKNFTTADGLTGNEVFYICEDSRGRIWIVPFQSKLCYYQDGKFKIYDKIEGIEQKVSVGLVENDEGQYWLATFNGVYKFDDHITTLIDNRKHPDYRQLLQVEFPHRVRTIRQIMKGPSGDIWALSNAGIHIYRDTLSQIVPLNSGNEPRMTLLLNGELLCVPNSRSPDEKKLYRLTPGQDWRSFEIHTGLFREFPDLTVNGLLEEEDRELWLGTNNGLLRVRHLGQPNEHFDHYLKNIAVTHLFRDREKNIWITTLEQGIYLLVASAKHIYQIKANDPVFTSMSVTADNDLIVGSAKGTLHIVRNHQLWPYHLPEQVRAMLSSHKITNILSFIDGMTWIAYQRSMNLIVLHGNGQTTLPYSQSIKDFLYTPRGDVYMSTHKCVYRFQKHEILGFITLENPTEALAYMNDKIIKEGRIYALAMDSDRVVWMGGHHGLYAWDRSQTVYYGDDFEDLQNSITDIQVDPKNTLWLATHGRGVIRFDRQQLNTFNVSNGLSSNICKKILVENDSTIWVATNQGINVIRFSAGPSPSIQSLSALEGLASNEVNDMIIHRDTVFAATMQGLSLFHKDKVNHRDSDPLLHLTGIKIWNKERPLQDSVRLAYNENNIEISYTGIYYKDAGDIIYQYKIEGIDTGWNETVQTALRFPQLSPGSYQFVIRSVNRAGSKSKAAAIHFFISPPFWQTWWFIAGMILLSLALTFTFIYIRIKRISRQEAMKRELLEAEQKALRAQMEPHFIFNSLSSINRFILRNEPDQASSYLLKFSSLMRRMLNYSEQKIQSLADEIETLRIYLDLESRRFEVPFQYQIDIDPGIPAESVMIPTMLIQPYVENAIKHGISVNPANGRISIRFSRHSSGLLCIVEDNGIGRKRSLELKGQSAGQHISLGMKITQDRLGIYERFGQESHVEIEDLNDSDPQATGTRVRIYLPIEKEGQTS